MHLWEIQSMMGKKEVCYCWLLETLPLFGEVLLSLAVLTSPGENSSERDLSDAVDFRLCNDL